LVGDGESQRERKMRRVRNAILTALLAVIMAAPFVGGAVSRAADPQGSFTRPCPAAITT
jgi:hypothetical protein